jgi:hypothetical protein
MKNFSLTITGIIVMVAGTLLVEWGFTEGCSSEITSKIPLLIGGVISWIGRYRQGDVNMAGFKK